MKISNDDDSHCESEDTDVGDRLRSTDTAAIITDFLLRATPTKP